ncbi:MAG: hypothetical protein AB1938_10105 [Myxococcota bacterium]
MSPGQRRAVVATVVLAAALVAVVTLWPEAAVESGSSASGGDAGAPEVVAPHARLEELRKQAPSVADGGLPPARPSDPRVVAEFGWGSGERQLGRARPDEANPEAPMSLTVDAQGNVWIVDQVNGRLVRVDRNGKPLADVPLPLQAAQDVVVARDGTAVVMDRLVDRSIALIGPDGKLKGELPVEGKGLEEGGGSTGVFTDGDDVYVEREHGDLVKVGSTKGVGDPERPEAPGRPSKDGQAWLSAGIVDAAAGLVMVTAIEKPSQAHRFTRQYALGARVVNLNLLDSDASGIIYLGSVVEAPGSTDEAPQFAVLLLCMDPVDGRPLGRVELPANTGAEETFKELVVQQEGGVVYLHRTEQGAQVLRVSCP